jgi:hypothetical protein
MNEMNNMILKNVYKSERKYIKEILNKNYKEIKEIKTYVRHESYDKEGPLNNMYYIVIIYEEEDKEKLDIWYREEWYDEYDEYEEEDNYNIISSYEIEEEKKELIKRSKNIYELYEIMKNEK